MKKALIILAVVLASCKTAKQKNCDAYSKNLKKDGTHRTLSITK